MQWNVGYITRKRAELSPDAIAIIYEDQPVTYGDLTAGVNRCAHLLQQCGITKGDRVAVLLENCVEFL